MGIKKGTKLTDTPKDHLLRVRMDQETLKKLDECAATMDTTRSHAVRIAINRLEEYVRENWPKK